KLSQGTWTHDHPISLREAAYMGLPVSGDMPKDFYQLMSLYPQPVRRLPAVQYIPMPYGPPPPPAKDGKEASTRFSSDGVDHPMPYNERYQPRFPWYSYLWPLLWLFLLGGVLLWRFWPRPPAMWDAAIEARAVTPRGDLAQEEKATIEIFRNASPSVVHVTN